MGFTTLAFAVAFALADCCAKEADERPRSTTERITKLTFFIEVRAGLFKGPALLN
jgi:hypothetical protein